MFQCNAQIEDKRNPCDYYGSGEFRKRHVSIFLTGMSTGVSALGWLIVVVTNVNAVELRSDSTPVTTVTSSPIFNLVLLKSFWNDTLAVLTNHSHSVFHQDAFSSIKFPLTSWSKKMGQSFLVLKCNPHRSQTRDILLKVSGLPILPSLAVLFYYRNVGECHKKASFTQVFKELVHCVY